MDLLTVLILTAGFLGFYTLFIKVQPAVKFLAIAAFIHCFFSHTPLTSFTAYISLIACIYFYIILTHLSEIYWQKIFKTVFAFLCFNIFFMVMQYFHKDILLNFGVGQNIGYFGLIGSRMRLESFLIVALAFLISKPGPHYWALGPIVFVSILIFFFAFHYTSLAGHLGVRLNAWGAILKLTQQHPFIGFGIGSFKDLFMPISGLKDGQGYWGMAHNDFLQAAFEFGYIGLAFMLFFIWTLGKQLKKKSVLCFLGLLIICADMMVHFPLHQWQTVLIITIFLAYCQNQLGEAFCR